MRYLCLLLLLIVGIGEGIAQSTGKISYTISNGLQIAGVDGTNPVVYDNDWLSDTPEDAFIWLKAHNGEVNLVGNINTRDMYGCSAGNCTYTIDDTFREWVDTYKAVTEMGLRNVPAPIKGSNEALTKPASGRIEDTQYYVSDGSELILREARNASVARPLVVLIGGNPTSVANAYLKDPSIADKIVVFHVGGWDTNERYNMTDSWGTYVVLKKLKYVNYGGDLAAWYNGNNINVTPEMIASLPSNPLTNTMTNYWATTFAQFQDLCDAPVVLYLFDHSLWKNVQRRTEDRQTTTSNDYDYLIISENDWMNYGPTLMNYLTNPDNYLVSTSTNTAPLVSMTSPANNASYNQGSSITISANASDANGTVAKVEFYTGSTKLGEDLTSPYSFVWNGSATGNHSITAKATDNEGASTTSGAVSISVIAPNTNPTVNITSPGNNATYAAGVTVTIAATAADVGGSISKVEFFNGTTKLGEDLTSPYSFAWANIPAGTFSLTVKATDNQGAATTSSVITISASSANTPPAVSITSPANNTSFTAGASPVINASANDANGTIAKVEFFNGAAKLGEDLISPYSFTWSNAPIGTHSILAKATDNQGAVTNSTAISLLVVAPNTPPVVNITSPTNNASYTAGAAIAIAATATDANGSVVQVEFFNGTTKLGEDVTSPFSISWANAPVGTHTLTAKATDNQNLMTTSAAVTITVAALPGAPLVSMTSPVNNSSVEQGSSITLSATASQSNGAITKVEFFNGGTKLGEDLVAPYSIVWSNATAGTHSLSAKATDTNNLTATSAVSIITVIAPNVPPVVSIVTPGNKATFNANASVSITASATDPNGSVAKVEFFSGSVKLGEDLTSPYNFNWQSVSPGIYVIVAKATDNHGLSASHQVQVTVNPANKPPLASAGDDITAHLPAESFRIQGTGSDPEEGALTFSWTQVSGPQNASLKQGTDGELHVSNVSEGSYVFELAVTDNGDLTTKDQMVLLVLSPNTLLGQVPRYFTPNNDGMNDFWEWPSIELYENALLTVFNRVGQKVYETTSYQNNWNGNVDGKPLQSDAYYYIIKLGNTALKGAVRIIR